MTKPTNRILALLELLQAHDLISGSELARRLNVDGRSVRRYIQALEELGIPVVTEAGRYGGYRLVAGYKLPPMVFTPEETQALCLGLMAARRLGLADTAPATASAQAKLERVLPDKDRRQVRALTGGTQIDLQGIGIQSSGDNSDHSKLLQLSSAAEAQQRVELDYHNQNGEGTRRQLDPYGLVFSQGQWYVSGWCHLRQSLRSFRLARLSAITLLPAYFGKPENFDALEHLSHSIATAPRAFAVAVELKTDRKNAEAALGRKIGPLSEEDGKLILRTRTDSLDWFARRLCGLGFDFAVLEPPALRDAIRKRAQHLLELL